MAAMTCVALISYIVALIGFDVHRNPATVCPPVFEVALW
jgi:hypothetical protein